MEGKLTICLVVICVASVAALVWVAWAVHALPPLSEMFTGS